MRDLWETVPVRVGVGLAIVVAAVLVPLASAPAVHQQTELDVDVTVLGTTTNDNGSLRAVNVRVTNHGDDLLQPVFQTWGMRHKTQLPWIASGPDVIGAGETATYQVALPDRYDIGLRPASSGLIIRDRGTQRRLVVPLHTPRSK